MMVYGNLATNEIATKLVASHADVLRGLSRVCHAFVGQERVTNP